MKKRIFVVGSANMDVVISLAKVPDRGESVIADEQCFVPGGKGANRAVSLARLGAEPVFSCCLGTDSSGDTLAALYEREGLDKGEIEHCSAAGTGTAYIFVEPDGSNRITIYPGANDLYLAEKTSRTVAAMNTMSMLSLELEIPLTAVETLIAQAAKNDVPAVVDAGPVRAGVELEIFKGAYILSPNESEAFALTGIRIENEKTAKEACRALFAAGVRYALIKLGKSGSVCYDGSNYCFCPAFNRAGEAVDTTAAGDSYMAGLCFALTQGRSIEDAMRYGSVVAGISVTRSGAIPSLPYAYEVNDYIEKYPTESGIKAMK